MRHTRKRQLYNFQKKRTVVFINFEMNHWNSIEDSLDKSFKWIRFESEHYKKTRNYYIFKGEMYARKIK